MILIDFPAVKSRVFYLKSFWPIKWVKRKSFFTVKWHLLPITPLHTTSYTTKTHPDLPNTTLLSPILTWYICNIALAGISKKLAPPLPTRAPISTTTFFLQLHFTSSLHPFGIGGKVVRNGDNLPSISFIPQSVGGGRDGIGLWVSLQMKPL